MFGCPFGQTDPPASPAHGTDPACAAPFRIARSLCGVCALRGPARGTGPALPHVASARATLSRCSPCSPDGSRPPLRCPRLYSRLPLRPCSICLPWPLPRSVPPTSSTPATSASLRSIELHAGVELASPSLHFRPSS
jgi:hypothetical protein